jgi:hypothetical protein
MRVYSVGATPLSAKLKQSVAKTRYISDPGNPKVLRE